MVDHVLFLHGTDQVVGPYCNGLLGDHQSPSVEVLYCRTYHHQVVGIYHHMEAGLLVVKDPWEAAVQVGTQARAPASDRPEEEGHVAIARRHHVRGPEGHCHLSLDLHLHGSSKLGHYQHLGLSHSSL